MPRIVFDRSRPLERSKEHLTNNVFVKVLRIIEVGGGLFRVNLNME